MPSHRPDARPDQFSVTFAGFPSVTDCEAGVTVRLPESVLGTRNTFGLTVRGLPSPPASNTLTYSLYVLPATGLRNVSDSLAVPPALAPTSVWVVPTIRYRKMSTSDPAG